MVICMLDFNDRPNLTAHKNERTLYYTLTIPNNKRIRSETHPKLDYRIRSSSDPPTLRVSHTKSSQPDLVISEVFRPPTRTLR